PFGMASLAATAIGAGEGTSTMAFSGTGSLAFPRFEGEEAGSAILAFSGTGSVARFFDLAATRAYPTRPFGKRLLALVAFDSFRTALMRPTPEFPPASRQ